MPLTADARCAFARCQAGGVILAGAPRVIPPRVVPLGGRLAAYHPGCWSAEVEAMAAGEAVRLLSRIEEEPCPS